MNFEEFEHYGLEKRYSRNDWQYHNTSFFEKVHQIFDIKNLKHPDLNLKGSQLYGI
jgi:hypothetical protein